MRGNAGSAAEIAGATARRRIAQTLDIADLLLLGVLKTFLFSSASGRRMKG